MTRPTQPTRTDPVDMSQRLQIAALVAVAGLIVAVSMTAPYSSVRVHLHQPGFHAAALLGAALAGFVCADWFGRAGKWGAARALAAALCVTLAGAGLGAILLAGHDEGVSAAALGWLALAQGLGDCLTTAMLWLSAMVLVHVVAGRLRQPDG